MTIMSPIPIDPAASVGMDDIDYSSACYYSTWLSFSSRISKNGYEWAHWTLLF